MRDIFRPGVSEESFDESEQIPSKAKCCTGVSVDIRQFLSPWSKQLFTNPWPACGGVSSLLPVVLSCLTLQSLWLLSRNILGERSHFMREKKKRWEGGKMFILCLSFLTFQAFPANAFHSTGTFVIVHYCPLTWFYHSDSKDAHHLGLQE